MQKPKIHSRSGHDSSSVWLNVSCSSMQSEPNTQNVKRKMAMTIQNRAESRKHIDIESTHEDASRGVGFPVWPVWCKIRHFVSSEPSQGSKAWWGAQNYLRALRSNLQQPRHLPSPREKTHRGKTVQMQRGLRQKVFIPNLFSYILATKGDFTKIK